jgi:3-oxoacyl-[acyl-carrier-protein] synthase III
VFHQASKVILDRLRAILAIPEAKFCRAFSDCGNTIASSIPIALKRASEQGRIGPGTTTALVGFGVGYSWSATLVRWT